MDTKRPLFVAAFVFLAATARGQQSLYQSTSGDTSIYLNGAQAGLLLVNLGASKATVGFLHGYSNWGLGIDFTGVAQGGVVSLVKNGIPQTGLGGDLSLTKRRLLWTPPTLPAFGSTTPLICRFCSDWLVLQFGYQHSTLNALQSVAAPLQQPQTHGFDAYTGRVAYNQLFKSSAGLLSGDYLLGESIGISRTNNTNPPNALPTAQFSSQITTATSANQQSVVSQNTKTVYVGDYTVYNAVPLNADAIWYPTAAGGHVGIDAFERSNVVGAFRYFSPGIGIFICQDKNPGRPIGGVTVSYQNQKAQLSLITGWTF